MRRVAQCPFVYFWTFVFVWAGIVTEGTVLSCFVQRGVNLQTIWGNNANSNNCLPPFFLSSSLSAGVPGFFHLSVFH